MYELFQLFERARILEVGAESDIFSSLEISSWGYSVTPLGNTHDTRQQLHASPDDANAECITHPEVHRLPRSQLQK
jgi:hypothetical protein